MSRLVIFDESWACLVCGREVRIGTIGRGLGLFEVAGTGHPTPHICPDDRLQAYLRTDLFRRILERARVAARAEPRGSDGTEPPPTSAVIATNPPGGST